MTSNHSFAMQYHPANNFPRCPFEKMFSFIYRERPREIPIQETRVLEIGCGACNNLFFAALEGFQCWGIDISQAALDYGGKRLAQHNLHAELNCGSFIALPYSSDFFDLTVERGALVCVPFEQCKAAVNEVFRVLKPNGKFFCSFYSKEHSIYLNHGDCSQIFIPISDSLMTGYTAGCFYDQAMINELFVEHGEIMQIILSHDQYLLREQNTACSVYYVEVRKR